MVKQNTSKFLTDIEIKELRRNEEFFQAIELQKRIWRLRDYGDCIPNHVFLAVSEIGGLVLGAFKERKLVGFLMAMPGLDQKEGFFHHSHILGVHPEVVHHNIGFQLKKAHYQLALSRGIQKITWTYDPLLGPNANLNVAKLGGIVRNYKVNYYGETMGESELVSGIPSDRFWLEWYIRSRHVSTKLSALKKQPHPLPDLQPINTVTGRKSTAQVMTGFSTPQNPRILIQIPLDFQAIYDYDKALALDWRLKTREVFQICLQMGFTVTDFYHLPGRGNYYYLEQHFTVW